MSFEMYQFKDVNSKDLKPSDFRINKIEIYVEK